MQFGILFVAVKNDLVVIDGRERRVSPSASRHPDLVPEQIAFLPGVQIILDDEGRHAGSVGKQVLVDAHDHGFAVG